ncbi:MAG: ABC transporter permease [Cyanobacteria bacterium J06632_22]
MRTVLSNVLAIYRRELQSYFGSPLAYGVATVFWLLAGILLAISVFGPSGLLFQQAAMDQAQIPAPPIDMAYEFMRFFLGLLGSLSMFVLPMLSMGLYTEERKQGTLELLATSPVTNWAVAFGKLLGVVTFFITMLVPLLVCELLIVGAADPPLNLVSLLVGHLGLILLAASILSLGMFVSSLTSSTVLAAMMTFGLMLVLWILEGLGEAVPGPAGAALAHLSVLNHYDDFIQGIFDTSGVVLFGSYILLGLFLTAQSIEALRFQRS